MNIVYFTNYYFPQVGAASRYTEKIVRYLANHGHKIVVLVRGSQTNQQDKTDEISSNNKEKFHVHQNITIISSNPKIKHPYSTFFSHIENFFTFIKKKRKTFRPHVIISQYHSFHFAPIFGALLAKFFKIPHVVRSHDIFSPYYGKMQKNASILEIFFLKISAQLTYNSIKYTDLFFTTSSEHKQHLEMDSKFKNTLFKLHPNGININTFFPAANNILKEKYHCQKLITYVGLLDVDLGIQIFIESMIQIKKIYPKVHFLIIGSGKDKNFLENLIDHNRINDFIHLIPPVKYEDIPFYVNNSDFCLGILSDDILYKHCIPVKCIEYMACRKTFISTQISKDISVFNKKSNLTGLFVNVIDPDEIAKKAIFLLEKGEYRKKLEDNGYKLVINKFNWEELMKFFELEINNLVKRTYR